MHHDIQLFAEYAVTPFVGVWIETIILREQTRTEKVTPFVGVWIETSIPMCLTRAQARSHPSWVCGLKRCSATHLCSVSLSHPSWVCGLKQHTDDIADKRLQVTPFVGVWIETKSRITERNLHACHTLRGCVD